MTPAAVLLRDLALPAVERAVHRMLDLRPAVEQGDDPDAVHDFRVVLRRLRAALEVFGPALVLPEGGDTAAVRRVGRHFRALRDADVLIAWLREAPAAGAAVRVELHRILDVLGRRRDDALSQARAGFRSRAFTGLRRALGRWVAHPEWRWAAGLGAREALPDLLSPILRRFWLHPGWGVGASLSAGRLRVDPAGDEPPPGEPGLEALHRLRRIGKRVRYQVEWVADLAGPGTARRIEQLRACQSVLGRLHDAHVLAQTLADLCEGEASRRLPVLMAGLAGRRAQAWRDWRPLQRHFLRPDARAAWRLLGRGEADVRSGTAAGSPVGQYVMTDVGIAPD